ncbi:hypothetical protein ABKN59_008685 [Abortiporus biennis]
MPIQTVFDDYATTSYLRQYCRLIGSVILYYDYLLTFDDEVRYIWGRKGSTLWIFYINRYFSTIALIVSMIGLFPTASLSSETICSKFETYEQVTIVIAQLITSVTLLLRTFALYTQSRKILAIILSIGLPLIGLIVWSVANQHADSQVTLFIGCLVIGTETQNVKSRLGFAWVALIPYEILIFLLTIIKTYRGRNVTYHAAAGHVGGLVELMCRDGAIYFAIMIWFNIANTVTFYIGSPALQGCLSRLASSVSVSLISRLIINLRKQYLAGMPQAETLPDPNVNVLSLSIPYNYRDISSTSTSSYEQPRRSTFTHSGSGAV